MQLTMWLACDWNIIIRTTEWQTRVYHSQCVVFDSRSEKSGDWGIVSGSSSRAGSGLYWRTGLATCTVAARASRVSRSSTSRCLFSRSSFCLSTSSSFSCRWRSHSARCSARTSLCSWNGFCSANDSHLQSEWLSPFLVYFTTTIILQIVSTYNSWYLTRFISIYVFLFLINNHLYLPYTVEGTIDHHIMDGSCLSVCLSFCVNNHQQSASTMFIIIWLFHKDQQYISCGQWQPPLTGAPSQ